MSARVEDHLLSTERVLVQTRRHLVVAALPVALGFVGVVVLSLLVRQVPVGNPIADVLMWIMLLDIAVVTWRILEWRNDIFVVTDRRVMLFTGFITRRVAMMPLVKVTDMTYRRTVAGRILGYGDFVMESAGQDQALHIVAYLPQPQELYHRVSGILFGGKPADTGVVAKVEE